MKDVTLVIPGEAMAVAKIPRQRIESELKRELAIQLYREGLISGFGAARIAGVTKAEFQYFLGQRRVYQQYDVEDYEQDMENLSAWQAGQ
jgi:predicted HTH domain antitoxin